MDRPIYLDHAAATPLDSRVLAAMEPYFSQSFYNPSADYIAARQVKADVQAARAKIAHYLGVRSNEIIFTAGGTEANNLVVHGVMAQYPGAKVVASAVEHDSLRRPVMKYAHEFTPVHPDGRLDTAALSKLIDDTTALVSVQYVNNEIGTVQPLAEIAAIIRDIRSSRAKRGISLPIWLHTDACQAPAYLTLNASRLSVDFMTLNAGKIYGPKQVGALYASHTTSLTPQMLGGGHERGYRSGTENVPGIMGFAKAMELAQDARQDTVVAVSSLRDLFIETLQKFEGAMVNGSLKHRIANNVHVTFKGQDNERLMMLLDESGIQCAVGSACKASNDEPSHVLTAIGLSELDAQSSLRFTLGKDTTEQDIRIVTDTLVRITA